jgi:hypothetical protein
MSHSQSQYFLSRHAFVCVAQGHAVFLDLKKDKYTALAHSEARALDGAVLGWPFTRVAAGISDGSVQADQESVVRSLREEGLITDARLLGKDANPVTLERASSDLRLSMEGEASASLLQVTNFVTAWALITLALRTRSLEYTVERIRRRKAEQRHAPPLDPEVLQPLIASYFTIQPHFFSAYDACLRNSLTLAEYLARHRMYPTWVFGVNMEPWRAHSWLQEGPLVLNDTVEHVRGFTPILTI